MEIENIPTHVAIICDGNRRWARERGLPDFEGHRSGFENARKRLPDAAINLGIKYITFWVFSTENWKREKTEVNYLMDLFANLSSNLLKDCKKKKIRFHHIGRFEDLPEKVKKGLKKLEEETKEFDEHHFILALNHGGRDEIVRATRKMIDLGVKSEDVTEESFSKYLDTKNIPAPDLIIRTSGELRLSGFLMWESAYSELYFTNCYFPDFDDIELKKAVENYSSRNRRFGGNSVK